MSCRDRVAQKGTRDNQRYEWVMDRARAFFQPGFRALEVGLGDGVFAAGLDRIGYHTYSVDVLPLPANLASQPWSHFIMDICQGRLAGTFDLVHCGQTLEHVDDPDAAMDNIMAMTHPDSLVLVSVPNFTDPGHLRTYSQAGFLADMGRYLNIHETKTFAGNSRECYACAGRHL